MGQSQAKPFDDYDYKRTDKRIKVRFVQKEDEPMYPWEIAGFLNNLNTVYYKYELLNSICSALAYGIPASDIFVFDKSLPLYQRYSEMSTLTETEAAMLFYKIGLPHPLVPDGNSGIYDLQLLYRAFGTINSFLHDHDVGPLPTKTLTAAYQIMQIDGLAAAEEHVIDLAVSRSAKSAENAQKKNRIKQPPSKDEIVGSLKKYYEQKTLLLADIQHIATLSDEERLDLLTSSKKDDRRRLGILTSFFKHFDGTLRPLVCVRIAPGKFLILGRSLVNKQEQTGLELKEATRNSPLGAILEGGVAIYQAIKQEERNKELHEKELQKQDLDIAIRQQQLKQEELRTTQMELLVVRQLNELAGSSDVRTIRELNPSFTKNRLIEAYSQQSIDASIVLHRRGLVLDEQSVKVIDEKV